jgi:hypothetical protein
MLKTATSTYRLPGVFRACERQRRNKLAGEMTRFYVVDRAMATESASDTDNAV